MLPAQHYPHCLQCEHIQAHIFRALVSEALGKIHRAACGSFLLNAITIKITKKFRNETSTSSTSIARRKTGTGCWPPFQSFMRTTGHSNCFGVVSLSSNSCSTHCLCKCQFLSCSWFITTPPSLYTPTWYIPTKGCLCALV